MTAEDLNPNKSLKGALDKLIKNSNRDSDMSKKTGGDEEPGEEKKLKKRKSTVTEATARTE